jgi:hypothetical protein
MKFDQGKWSVVRRGLGASLLAVPFVLAGVGCAAAPADDEGVNGGGFSGAPASGGAGTPPLVGTHAGTGGAGGSTPVTVAGGTGGAGGRGDVVVTAGSGGAGGSAMGGAGGVGGVGGMAGGTAGSAPPAMASCLDGITDFQSAGPFTFKMETEGAVKMWVPDVPAGCKVPMVHMANGTGASCATYNASMERLASHGFFGLCYENANTGAGTQGIMAFEAGLAKHPELADMKFGSTGHSQGGQSSFIVLQFAEEKWPGATYSGLAMEPASGFGSQPAGGSWQSIYAKIKSPMFMFSGVGTDGLVSQGWVQQAFDAMSDTVEAYFWARNGATHIPVPNGEEMQLSIPWFRWTLLGDNEACKAFKNIPTEDTTWVIDSEKNARMCM